MGVMSRKNNKPNTKGLVILPSSRPSRNHSRFSGASNDGAARPTTANSSAPRPATRQVCEDLKYSDAAVRVSTMQNKPASLRLDGSSVEPAEVASINSPVHNDAQRDVTKSRGNFPSTR